MTNEAVQNDVSRDPREDSSDTPRRDAAWAAAAGQGILAEVTILDGLAIQLEREVAELREDAERYRWLRHENERHCDEEQPCVMLHAQNDWGNWVWLAIDDGEHMDATIDKARSECHAQGGSE